MKAPNAYLDNNVVCALAKDDMEPVESAAFDSLMEIANRDAECSSYWDQL